MSATVPVFYVLVAVIVSLIAVVVGSLTAWWLLRRRSPAGPPDSSTGEFSNTEFVDAEIDLASVKWQEVNNLPPEAAGVMAARLKTLARIHESKGRR